jgi:hypothetical protein
MHCIGFRYDMTDNLQRLVCFVFFLITWYIGTDILQGISENRYIYKTIANGS